MSYINDLPRRVKSTVRLFADDCLLSKTIRTIQDQIQLQSDLNVLKNGQVCGACDLMRLNATSC